MKINKTIISIPVVISLFSLAVKVQIDMMKKKQSVTSTTGIINRSENSQLYKIDDFKEIISATPANSADNINSVHDMLKDNNNIAATFPILKLK